MKKGKRYQALLLAILMIIQTFAGGLDTIAAASGTITDGGESVTTISEVADTEDENGDGESNDIDSTENTNETDDVGIVNGDDTDGADRTDEFVPIDQSMTTQSTMGPFAVTYTLILDAGEGEFAPGGDKQHLMPDIEPNADVSIPNNEPTRAGYRFMGWIDDDYEDNGKIYRYSEEPSDDNSISNTYTVVGDTTLNAKWEGLWKVTYNLNCPSSSECTEEITDNDEYIAGEKITLGTPVTMTHEDYTFIGWEIESDEADPVILPAGTEWVMTPPADSGTDIGTITFKGVWEETTITVSFEVGDATGEGPTEMKVYSGQKITLPASLELTKEGYYFIGWRHKDDASGIIYGPGTDHPEIVITENTTFVAQWVANPTLRYNANGGKGSLPVISSTGHMPGNEISISGNSGDVPLSRIGYVFAGWTLNPEGRGIAYGAKTGLDLPNELLTDMQEIYIMTKSNVTFYAKWLRQVNVSFDSYGGQGATPSVENSYLESCTYTFTEQDNPTKDGYTFAGWYTDGDSGTLYGFGKPNATYILSNKNVTFVAKWLPGGVTDSPFAFSGWDSAVPQMGVAGDTITFNCTVSAEVENYTIIWQRSTDGGYNWSNIPNSAQTIAESTEGTVTSYKTSALKVTDHNNRYRIKVTAEISKGAGSSVSFEDYSPYVRITVVDVYPTIINETPYRNRITWTGADIEGIKYAVSSRAANEKDWGNHATSTETAYVHDVEVLPKTVYHYKVVVSVANQEIGSSPERSITTAAVTAPTKQKLIKTTPTTMEIKWNTVKTAELYSLSVTDMDTAGKPVQVIHIDAQSSGTEQTAKLTGLNPNHNYQVKIAAAWEWMLLGLEDEDEEEIPYDQMVLWSGVVKGKTSGPAPGKPTLVGTAVGKEATIKINALTASQYKDDAADPVCGYYIMKDNIPVNDADAEIHNGFIASDQFEGGVFSYTARDLIPGRKSSFTVAACWSDGSNGAGGAEGEEDDTGVIDGNYRMGKPSAALSVTPTGMAAPSTLKAKNISMTGFDITWSGNRDIVGYNIYVDGEIEGEFSADEDSETYIDGRPATTYNVEVAGVYASGEDYIEGKRKSIQVKTPGGAAPASFKKVGWNDGGGMVLEWKRIPLDLKQEKGDYYGDDPEVTGYVLSRTVGNKTEIITGGFDYAERWVRDSDGYYDLEDDTTKYSYADYDIFPGMTVTYTVQACYGDGYFGTRSSAVKITIPCPVPSGLGGWSDPTSITATWKDVGAEYYLVYLYDAKGQVIEYAYAECEEANDGCTFSGLKPGTQYQFRVAAVWEDSADEPIYSKLSAAKKLKTGGYAPKNFIKKNVTATEVTLQWRKTQLGTDEDGDGIVGYRINRNGEWLYNQEAGDCDAIEKWRNVRYKDEDGDWYEDEVLISTEYIYEFVDEELEPGMTYTYTLQACWGDEEEDSDLSGPATAPCKVKTLGNIPTWKSVTVTPTSITAEWKVSKFTGNTREEKIKGEAMGYNVYLYDAAGHQIDAGMNVEGVKYTFSDLDPNTQYQLRVSALWEIITIAKDPDYPGEEYETGRDYEIIGGLSGVKTALTTGPAPGNPAVVAKPVKGADEVKLKWSLPSGMNINQNDLKGFLITRTIGTDMKYIFVDMEDYKTFYEDQNTNGWIDYEVAPGTKVSYTIQACWADNSKGIAFCQPGKKTKALTVSIPQ